MCMCYFHEENYKRKNLKITTKKISKIKNPLVNEVRDDFANNDYKLFGIFFQNIRLKKKTRKK